jgi:hypothetical protein
MSAVRIVVALCGAACAAVVAVACSGGDHPATFTGVVGAEASVPSPTDGATSQVPSTDGGTDAPSVGTELCADVPQQGLVVDELPVHADPPDPAGGVIAPGTYVLSDLAVYTGALSEDNEAGAPGASGNVERSMLTVVAGGGATFRGARGTAGGGVPADVTEGFTFQVQGVELVLTRICPAAGAPQSVRFTALTGGVSLFRDATHRALYIRLDP